jgi:hypothetical protein
MASPHPKPKSLKLISGTTRPDRDEKPGDPVEYDRVEQFPDPPFGLTAHGIIFWNHYGPILTKSGVLTVGDMGAFHQLTLLWSELLHNNDLGHGSPASLHQSLISMWAYFGMVPAARMKMKLNSETPKRNEFDDE